MGLREGKEGIFRRDTGGMGIGSIAGLKRLNEAHCGYIQWDGWKTWCWCRFEDQALRDSVLRNGHSPVESWL